MCLQANLVAARAANQLAATIPSTFSISSPTTWYQRYRATIEHIDGLVRSCHQETDLDILQSFGFASLLGLVFVHFPTPHKGQMTKNQSRQTCKFACLGFCTFLYTSERPNDQKPRQANLQVCLPWFLYIFSTPQKRPNDQKPRQANLQVCLPWFLYISLHLIKFGRWLFEQKGLFRPAGLLTSCKIWYGVQRP